MWPSLQHLQPSPNTAGTQTLSTSPHIQNYQKSSKTCGNHAGTQDATRFGRVPRVRASTQYVSFRECSGIIISSYLIIPHPLKNRIPPPVVIMLGKSWQTTCKRGVLATVGWSENNPIDLCCDKSKWQMGEYKIVIKNNWMIPGIFFKQGQPSCLVRNRN